MIDLDDFLPEILPKAPGAPAPAVYKAILAACDEFCTRTKLWRYSEDLVINSTDEIDFYPPSDTVMVDIESVFFNDLPLESKPVDWLDMAMRGWRRGLIEGFPRFFAQTSMNTLRITPIDNGVLTVNVFLKPGMDAEQVEDFLFTQYHEVIAWGALGRLLATPNQPFTDVNASNGYMMSFEGRLNSLAFKGVTGQQRAPLRSRATYM